MAYVASMQVYKGSEHPHEAQQPVRLRVASTRTLKVISGGLTVENILSCGNGMREKKSV